MSATLDELLARHAENVRLSQAAWLAMVEAQAACREAREREHETHDAIADYLNGRVRDTAGISDTSRFEPVGFRS